MGNDHALLIRDVNGDSFIKKPRLLIFDEATASLDEDTANQIAQTVQKLKGRATVLFITHRVPQGLQADQLHRL